eukprot:6250531-Prymnesium_polylepis.1
MTTTHLGTTNFVYLATAHWSAHLPGPAPVQPIGVQRTRQGRYSTWAWPWVLRIWGDANYSRPVCSVQPPDVEDTANTDSCHHTICISLNIHAKLHPRRGGVVRALPHISAPARAISRSLPQKKQIFLPEYILINLPRPA